ncbi:hypothetical protein OIE66_33995 [Nonomuraea sp. NBC_01738]|uniref:hypothetical protein n=1 Tax=Nonomuraea sp. NBC_01738 TaxID=2976003 RepID=UPI002E119E9A|nr:hypothetical protein OIE66_33995 [Nonomuraea sp. NBC_01738]
MGSFADFVRTWIERINGDANGLENALQEELYKDVLSETIDHVQALGDTLDDLSAWLVDQSSLPGQGARTAARHITENHIPELETERVKLRLFAIRLNERLPSAEPSVAEIEAETDRLADKVLSLRNKVRGLIQTTEELHAGLIDRGEDRDELAATSPRRDEVRAAIVRRRIA